MSIRFKANKPTKEFIEYFWQTWQKKAEMTNLMQYEKGCSPCAIQRKYGLTYVQGYELAERLKKTQELEL